MIPDSLVTSLIQAIAALLIFVIGYFALLVSVIFSLLVVALVFRAARLLLSRVTACSTLSPRSATARFVHDLRALPHFVSATSHRVAAAHKSGQ